METCFYQMEPVSISMALSWSTNMELSVHLRARSTLSVSMYTVLQTLRKQTTFQWHTEMCVHHMWILFLSTDAQPLASVQSGTTSINTGITSVPLQFFPVSFSASSDIGWLSLPFASPDSYLPLLCLASSSTLYTWTTHQTWPISGIS